MLPGGLLKELVHACRRAQEEGDDDDRVSVAAVKSEWRSPLLLCSLKSSGLCQRPQELRSHHHLAAKGSIRHGLWDVGGHCFCGPMACLFCAVVDVSVVFGTAFLLGERPKLQHR